MEQIDWAKLATIIASLFGGGGVASVVMAWKGAKKSDVDALRIIIETQSGVIDKLRARVDKLQSENDELRSLLVDYGIDPDKKKQRGLFSR